MDKHPLLYTFRRCPYAMRARMALVKANINVELREIDLKAKHADFLRTSPKATVPVLVLADGKLIDESLDILEWVHKGSHNSRFEKAHPLILSNDNDFVKHAMRYKYDDRYPELSKAEYRKRSESHLAKLEEALSTSSFVLGEEPTFVDIALFPFVRQFRKVDESWFDDSQYMALKRWTNYWENSDEFKRAMLKKPIWDSHSDPVYLFDIE